MLQPWVNIPIFVEGRLLEYLWGINLGGSWGLEGERVPALQEVPGEGQGSMHGAGSVLLTGQGSRTEVAGGWKSGMGLTQKPRL